MRAGAGGAVLRQEGLRYLVLDHAQLNNEEKRIVREVKSRGYSCTGYKEWGGVTVCKLESR